MMRLSLFTATAIACFISTAIAAPKLVETPLFNEDVAAGKLPPVERRVPAEPFVVEFDGAAKVTGRPGGELRWLISRARDVRFLTYFGYARLVAYDEKFGIHADMLASMDVQEDRIFTMRLRKGHKWSDGQPFTTEDFRYWWEDVVNNKELSPGGLPKELMVDGEAPKVEFIDELTLRYSWSRPNPYFLPRLAGTLPLYIYRPAHYLRKFHTKYGNADDLKKMAEQQKQRGWAGVHNRQDNMYEADNPDLPVLEPWVIVTKPPSTHFVARRNPYYYRVDSSGQQLPYVDTVVMNQSAPALIPAKSAAGETDLQARGLTFANFTFLKDSETDRNAIHQTYLWRTAKGAHFALFPNLNVNDEVWRNLLRDVRFRRALSLAIDRDEINDALFFGIALPGNNSILPESSLYKDEYRKLYAEFDLAAANKLLDDIGLTNRDGDGIRLLPDGRPCEIVVETAGEDTEQSDILELIRETWKKAGIKLFTKPSQREILRNRVFSGQTIMSVWSGIENGLPTPETSPAELAPTSQQSLQWPKWGQYYDTNGKNGDPVDMAEPKDLLQLNEAWLKARSHDERATIWHKMLQLHAEQQFTIGVIAGVSQPVTVNRTLRNLPKEGLYNFDPGAFFGIYKPDTFWFDGKPARITGKAPKIDPNDLPDSAKGSGG